MKKLFFLLLLVPFLFLACEKTEDPVLSISQETMEVSADGNSTTITLFANNPWTVSAPDWCTVSPKGGDGGQEVQVKVTVKENDTYADRSGTITFTSGELTKTFSVSQAANLGVVLPQKEYKVSSEAQQLEVTVKSNVEYTVDINVDWISSAGTKSLETTTLLFDIEPNESYDPRQGIINIIDGQNNDTIAIEVNQVQKDAIFVSPTEFSLNCKEHTLDLEVQTNVDLEVVIPDNAKSWVSHVSTKALQEKTVTLKVSANTDYEARNCEIQVKKKNDTYAETIHITQDQFLGVVIEQNEYTITGDAQPLHVKIQTNAELEYEVAENGKEWISVIETKALEDKVLILGIKANPTFENRLGQVLVRMAKSNNADTIKITQRYKDTLFVDNRSLSTESAGGTVEVKVSATVEYDVEILDQWITENQTKALGEKTHSFTVAANGDIQSRSSCIIFKSKTTSHKDTVTVNQGGQGGYVWYNGIEASKSVPGSGTEGDPYIIHTANDLQWLIDQTAYVDKTMIQQYGATHKDLLKTYGKYYKLTHDLEIDSDEDITDASGNVIQARGWTPIGSGCELGDYRAWHTFAGNFDGNGHTITGKMVPVSKPVAENEDFHFGFFGHCKAIYEQSGYVVPVIKNLNMTAVVNATKIPVAEEYVHIGAVVGYASEGITIINCKNSGNVSGPVYSTNAIQVSQGGILGSCEQLTTIESCENSGIITGGTFEMAQMGGVTGGIAGNASLANLKNLTNTGKVYGANTQSTRSGGIAGASDFNGMPNFTSQAVGLKNSAEITTSSASAVTHAGGIFGYLINNADKGVPMNDCHNTATVLIKEYTGTRNSTHANIGGLIGLNQFLVEMTDCSNSGDVILSNISAKTGNYINTAGGLVGHGGNIIMKECINEGDVSAGISTSTLYAAGLVGYPEGYGIYNSSNKGDVTVTANTANSQYSEVRIGGCAGNSYARIWDCINKGDVTVNGTTPSYVLAGGISGYSNSIYDPSLPSKQAECILRCTNEGKVSVTQAKEMLAAGGIVGVGFKTVNSTNKGDVTTAGTTTGKCYTGGIEGFAESSHTISGCSNSATISGGVSERYDSYVGGIIGSLEYMSKVINGCSNSGMVKYTVSGNANSFIGSIAGYVPVESRAEVQPIVCSCTKDTSNSGLPMIGGGYTTLEQHSECEATH